MKPFELHDAELAGIVGLTNPDRNIDHQLSFQAFAVSELVGPTIARRIPAVRSEDQKIIREEMNHLGDRANIRASPLIAPDVHLPVGEDSLCRLDFWRPRFFWIYKHSDVNPTHARLLSGEAVDYCDAEIGIGKEVR